MIEMKIGPHYKLIGSENNTKIIKAYSEDNRYYISETNIEHKFSQFSLKDENINPNDFNYLINALGSIKQNDSNISYAFIEDDKIFSISNISYDNVTYSHIKCHNLTNQEISTRISDQYNGYIYKLVSNNSLVGFLYFSEKKECCIKVFQTIDDLLSKKAFRDIKSPHIGKVCDIAFTSDNNYLCSCGYDGCVKRWDLRVKDTPHQSVFLTNGPIVSVKLNPFNESLFVVACTNGYLIIDDFDKKQKRRQVCITDENGNFVKDKKNESKFAGPATWADFSPVDPFLVIAFGNSKLKTYYIPDLF